MVKLSKDFRMIFFFSQIDGLFYFDKSVNHSINLKLDREHCPSSGLINFAIPVRISLQSKDGQWKEYFRAINRSMTVLPKTPTIPKDTNAPLRKLFFYIYIYRLYISSNCNVRKHTGLNFRITCNAQL